MWEYKLAALTFTLTTLGLVSFKFVTANRTAIFDDEEKLRNALEVVVNGTVPSESIRDKIYNFFFDLTVAQENNNNNKFNDKTTIIKKGNKRQFLLDLIPIIRDPTITQTGLIRYRRNCGDQEERFVEKKRALEEEKQRLIESNEEELKKLQDGLCKSRCEYKCEQFKCPIPNCPAIPKDPNICAEHGLTSCPQGCDKVFVVTTIPHKTKTKTTRGPNKKKALKISHEHKRQKRAFISTPDLEHSHFSPAYKSEIRFKTVISDLDELSRKAYLNKLKSIASSSKIKQETTSSMFDILAYLTKDNEKSDKKANLISRMQKKVKDNKKGEVVFRGVKIILGYIMPSSLTSSKIIKQFSAKVLKRFKREEKTRGKRWENPLDNEDDPYGCFICSPACPQVFIDGCDFNCYNNKGCQAYQCRCHLFKSDFTFLSNGSGEKEK